MSAGGQSADDGAASVPGLRRRCRWRRALLVTLGILCVPGALFVAAYRHPAWVRRRVIARIDRWMDTKPGPAATPLEATGINEVEGALHTALYNALWYPRNAPTEKLDVVADYLDRTRGADFRSFAGALHVVEMLGEVSPPLTDYARIEQLRVMQSQGLIPDQPRIPGAPGEPLGEGVARP